MKEVRVLGGTWLDERLVPKHSTRATLSLLLIHDDGREETFNGTWAKVPQGAKNALLSMIPICPCGRRRIALEENDDGYARCTFCRNQETCDTCGNTPTRIALLIGKRLCTTCHAKASAAATMEQIPEGVWRDVAREAQYLLTATSFEGSDETIAALFPSTPDSRQRGWAWYYVTPDNAVWGSHLTPSALVFLAQAERASGEWKQTLAAWIAGGPFRGGRNFFTATQLRSEQLTVPRTSHLETKIATRLGTLKLSN